MAVLAAVVAAVAASPWTGGGSLASAATVWHDARPQVEGRLTPCGATGEARLALRNEGDRPVRVYLQVVPAAAGPAVRVVVSDLTAGTDRVLYDGDLAGVTRLDVGGLPAGCTRVLRVEAAAADAATAAPRLRVSWTAVTGG